MSRGQIWVHFEKKHLPFDQTSDTKILITGGEGGDLSVRIGILKNSGF